MLPLALSFIFAVFAASSKNGFVKAILGEAALLKNIDTACRIYGNTAKVNFCKIRLRVNMLGGEQGSFFKTRLPDFTASYVGP